MVHPVVTHEAKVSVKRKNIYILQNKKNGYTKEEGTIQFHPVYSFSCEYTKSPKGNLWIQSFKFHDDGWEGGGGLLLNL